MTSAPAQAQFCSHINPPGFDSCERLGLFIYLFVTHACSGMSQGLPSIFFFVCHICACKFMHCMHILALIFQDGGNSFLAT